MNTDTTAPDLTPEAAPLAWRDAAGLVAEYVVQLRAVLSALRNATADDNHRVAEAALTVAEYLTDTVSSLYTTDPSGQTIPAPYP